MKLDDEDRRAYVTPSGSHLFATWTLTGLVVVLLAFIAIPELRDFAWQEAYGVASFVGVAPADNGFAKLYKRLQMAPLPAGVAASAKISPNLAKLAAEPCDKAAIFALGEALIADHEKRDSANAYLGFAATCPDSTGEEFRAAGILLSLGDNERAITVATRLIAKSPGIADYYYLRGKAMAGIKQYDGALADYRSTIKLQRDARDLGGHVFIEMANLYLATGKPCEAAAIILAWVALAPTTRDTPAARNMIDEYNARGCQKQESPRESRKL